MGPVLFSILILQIGQIGQVAVLDFTEEKSGDVWLPARTSDVVALKLRFLGFAVRDRSFARAVADPGRAGLEAVVWGRVRPPNAEEETERITIEVKVRKSATVEKLLHSEGRAADLERLATDIAIQVANTLGRPVPPELRGLLESSGAHPFAVHRFLGRAERRLQAGDNVQATLMFDRAGSFANQGAIPQAVSGRNRAENARVAQGGATFGSRSDLATSAAERAQVAIRAGDRDAARRALIDVLRYTTVRAKRWSADLFLGGPDRAVVVGRDKRWLVQTDAGPDGLWTLHPPTGVVLSVSAGKKGLVGTIGPDLLTLDGRILARMPMVGPISWKVSLPLEPARDLWERALLAQGSLGVRSRQGVVWVEVGLGALGQVATHAEPLAQSASGILVRTEDGIGLLRPGKKTPAWKVTVALEGAAMTADRVVLIHAGELAILQILDGREVDRVPAPKEGRLLRAHGRYACVAANDGTHLFDVLSGEKTAVLMGPGEAIDCSTESEGAAVLYRSGDLLFFNRDGKLLDRARVMGRAERLLRASPIAPGAVVVGDGGLVAFAEVGAEGVLRDVEAAVRLAELEIQRGDAAAALRWADWVAMESAGQVARAERIRARVLRGMKLEGAAKAAESRAAAVEKAGEVMPAFSIRGAR